jgi:hypothetical protein
MAILTTALANWFRLAKALVGRLRMQLDQAGLKKCPKIS